MFMRIKNNNIVETKATISEVAHWKTFYEVQKGEDCIGKFVFL